MTSTPHVYNDTFFDYIDAGARASAKALIAHLKPHLPINSVVDFGSGRGAWLAEWQASGVEDVCGLDGDYVDRDQLAIPTDAFRACLLYTSPSPRDLSTSRMPSSA